MLKELEKNFQYRKREENTAGESSINEKLKENCKELNNSGGARPKEDLRKESPGTTDV